MRLSLGKTVVFLSTILSLTLLTGCSLETAEMEKTDIDVVFEDERLTTVMAHNILSDNNVRGTKRKQTVDAVSAVMILQSYLDKNK